MFDGTCALTWYSPGKYGASPLNMTGAFCPPILTVTEAVVVAEASVT